MEQDNKHETSNDFMEYLKEEIRQEKERIISFLVLIIMIILSLISIVFHLAYQKKREAWNACKNVYSDNLLREGKIYEMVM